MSMVKLSVRRIYLRQLYRLALLPTLTIGLE